MRIALWFLRTFFSTDTLLTALNQKADVVDVQVLTGPEFVSMAKTITTRLSIGPDFFERDQ